MLLLWKLIKSIFRVVVWISYELSVVFTPDFFSEVMGALVSVLMIWVVTAVLVYLAIQRIITNDYEIDATIMLITSALAIVFNVM